MNAFDAGRRQRRFRTASLRPHSRVVASGQGRGIFRAEVEKENFHSIGDVLLQQTAQSSCGAFALATNNENDGEVWSLRSV
jgi:hypothetical protein